ncbi:mariner Mos1 transposase [Trichonephila clavipes]|nr:mariner Mos1 transposase [Trichonephila clavipes]
MRRLLTDVVTHICKQYETVTCDFFIASSLILMFSLHLDEFQRVHCILFTVLKMSNFMPSNHDLRTALIFCYHLKKNAAESHQMLVEAYGGNALSRAQCYRWSEKFQNGDFDMRNEECGRPAKKYEDAEMQALLDQDDGQTQEHLA